MTGPDHRDVIGTQRDDDACAPFWALVEPLLDDDGVEEGTIMGFPCLRVRGEFFAMPHHATGELICKLHRDRVAELIGEGTGQPFGPGAKQFKEWVLVDHSHRDRWSTLLTEARAFVNG